MGTYAVVLVSLLVTALQKPWTNYILCLFLTPVDWFKNWGVSAISMKEVLDFVCSFQKVKSLCHVMREDSKENILGLGLRQLSSPGSFLYNLE